MKISATVNAVTTGVRTPVENKKINKVKMSSSSAFPSYISGVHNFWVGFLRM